MKGTYQGLAAALVLAAFLWPKEEPVRTDTAEPAAAVQESYSPVSIRNSNSKQEWEWDVYTQPPKRTAAFWQNSVETLLALGAGDRIVMAIGVPDRKYLRPEYRQMYDQIPYKSMEMPDMETMLMAEPDLILGWSSTFNAKNLRSTDFWKERGIHTYIAGSTSPIYPKRTLDEEYRYVMELGEIFGKKERAEELVGRMEDAVRKASETARRQGISPRVVLIEFTGRSIHSYTKESLAGDIVARLGGELADPDSRTLNEEQLLTLDPDAIFVVLTEANYGREEEALQRVYTLPLYAVYSPGIRVYDGIEMLAKGMYP